MMERRQTLKVLGLRVAERLAEQAAGVRFLPPVEGLAPLGHFADDDPETHRSFALEAGVRLEERSAPKRSEPRRTVSRAPSGLTKGSVRTPLAEGRSVVVSKSRTSSAARASSKPATAPARKASSATGQVSGVTGETRGTKFAGSLGPYKKITLVSSLKTGKRDDAIRAKKLELERKKKARARTLDRKLSKV